MTALSITSLSKVFHAGANGCAARVSVLRKLDLALWPGEIVALAGARGSGRSTLLDCAAGLLRPDAGSISWFGARIAAREAIIHASVTAHHSRAGSSGCAQSGALHAALATAPLGRTRLVLVDDLPRVGAIERRLVLAQLHCHALAGAAILFVANEELACDPVVTRIVTLSDGALAQRRNRSAVRIAASSPDSRARARARSTYGRSLRSPQ